MAPKAPPSIKAERPWACRFENNGNIFVNKDGVRLYRRLMVPDSVRQGGKAHALVFYCHGAGEHSQRLVDFLDFMVQHNIVVVTHDHYGHGRSEGDRVDFTDPLQYAEDVIEDFLETKRHFPGVKSFLVGLSMGGMIAAQVASMISVSGAVLIAPAVIPDPYIATPFNVCMARNLTKCAPRCGIQRVDFKVATHDQSKIDEMVADPLVFQGKVKVRWANNMLIAMSDLQARAPAIKAPLLILQGTADLLCNKAGAQFLMDTAGSTDKTHIEYTDLFHDLLSELPADRQRVFTDIMNWILNHIDSGNRPISTSPAPRLSTDPAPAARGKTAAETSAQPATQQVVAPPAAVQSPTAAGATGSPQPQPLSASNYAAAPPAVIGTATEV